MVKSIRFLITPRLPVGFQRHNLADNFSGRQVALHPQSARRAEKTPDRASDLG